MSLTETKFEPVEKRFGQTAIYLCGMDFELIHVRSGELNILQGQLMFRVKADEYVFINRVNGTSIVKTGHCKETSFTINPKALPLAFDQVGRSYTSPNTRASKDLIFRLKPKPDLISLFISLEIYEYNHMLLSNELYYLKSLEALYALFNNSDKFFPLILGVKEKFKE